PAGNGEVFAMVTSIRIIAPC
ncbi:hypothetical protein EC960932_1635, partial [Escherichia coli 96.0932]